MRENNEGFQPDRNMIAGSGEFRPTDEITLSVRVITRTEIVTLKNMGERGVLALGHVQSNGATTLRLLRNPFPDRQVDDGDRKIVMDWMTYWNRGHEPIT